MEQHSHGVTVVEVLSGPLVMQNVFSAQLHKPKSLFLLDLRFSVLSNYVSNFLQGTNTLRGPTENELELQNDNPAAKS